MLCATISKLSLLIALALAGVAAAEPAAPSDAEVLEAFRAADPAVRDGLLALLEEATADEAHGRELEKKPKEYKIKIDKEVDDDGKIVKEKIAVGSKKTAKKALASLAKNLKYRCEDKSSYDFSKKCSKRDGVAHDHEQALRPGPAPPPAQAPSPRSASPPSPSR